MQREPGILKSAYLLSESSTDSNICVMVPCRSHLTDCHTIRHLRVFHRMSRMREVTKTALHASLRHPAT